MKMSSKDTDPKASESQDPAPEQPRLTLGQPLVLGGLKAQALPDLAAVGALSLPSLDGAAVSKGPSAVEEDVAAPSESAMARARRLAENYTKKSGTFLHPDPNVTEGVLLGLGRHIDKLKRPLCPCRFYPDEQEEVKHRTWICPCDDMQIYKYCHCLLFTNEEGQPITEHLPADHEGRRIWGEVKDPDPSKGRSLRDRAEARDEERRRRKS